MGTSTLLSASENGVEGHPAQEDLRLLHTQAVTQEVLRQLIAADLEQQLFLK